MSLTLIFDNFYGDTATLPAIWTQPNGQWRRNGFSNGSASAPTFLSGGIFMRAVPNGVGFASGTNQNTPSQMGKVALGTNWFTQVGGNSTNDKVAEISCDLVWRDQTDTITTTTGGTTTTTANHTTYLGLMFAGTLSTIGSYVVLVTRTGGTTPTTTGRLVRVSTGSTYFNPVFSDIGGAAITLPNASNGDRWTLKARCTWFAPSFGLASFLVSFANAAGVLGVIGMPSAINSGQYGFDTGQGSLATWNAGELYVGFLNRPGWRVGSLATGGIFGLGASDIMTPNHFERLRVADVGNLANLTTSTPAYTYPPAPNLVASAVSVESNASAYALTVQPSWTQETQDQWAVSTFTSDSGDRVAFPNQTRRRRKWAFWWTALDDSEKADLETLTTNVKGRFNSWTWTEPETNQGITVRFTTDIEFQKIGPSVWAAAAGVEEVLT
jgi:hypothetical protein